MTPLSRNATPSKALTPEQAKVTLANYLRTQMGERTELENDWRSWVPKMFQPWVSRVQPDGSFRVIPFGPNHAELWDHVWSIKPGVKPSPFVAVWARGAAKSTSVEMAVVALAARKIRRYALYISATQEQADDHVGNIGALLEYSAFGKMYPAASQRSLNKYGSSKGWRRSRLRTANGFTIDAMGLDTAGRGVKLEEMRPDLIIFDDIDEELDTPAATDKKILSLTRKILPAGAPDAAIIGIQNLVISDGIFARLCNIPGANKADFLQNRKISGPFPAIIDPVVVKDAEGRYRLIGGKPLWEGQDLAKCNEQIGEWGYSSWKVEAQQEVDVAEGGLFAHIDFEAIHVTLDEVPELVRCSVWVDPAVTSTDRSDSHGIQLDGLGVNDIIYRLKSWEGRATPRTSLRQALRWAIEYKCDRVGVETDQGGDVWEIAYNAVWDEMIKNKEIPESSIRPAFYAEKAGSGQGPKAHRASRMLVDYEQGRFRHVVNEYEPTYQVLEKALRRFPIRKPFDLTDAAFWCWYDLKEGSTNGVGASSDPTPIVRGFRDAGGAAPPIPHASSASRNTSRLWGQTHRPLWGSHAPPETITHARD